MESFGKTFDAILQAVIDTFTGVQDLTQDDYALCGPKR